MPSYCLVLDYLDYMDKIGVTTFVFENGPQICILSVKKNSLWLSWILIARFLQPGNLWRVLVIKTPVTEHKENKNYS